jgi:broad specificity phosphatase PhoE
VVTHGLVCRSLAARHLSLPDGAEVPERWENTAVTILDQPAAGADQSAATWRVRLLNCIAHLDDLAARPPAETGAA